MAVRREIAKVSRCASLTHRESPWTCSIIRAVGSQGSARNVSRTTQPSRPLKQRRTCSCSWQGSRMYTTASSSTKQDAINSPFPIFQTISDFRKWRAEVGAKGKKVGFVPTMGALHDGHLSLVRQSLLENDETVVSIFVNPAQFAPTEDLASYPRTLSTDIAALSSLSENLSFSPTTKGVSAIFAPTVPEMYPTPDGRPFTQVVNEQVGAFVEVQGLAHQMEGASRPTFFRGVATVCTKLFHIIQPDLAYFGQKDIQQAVILRRLVSDLLFSHPPSAQAVRVLPTSRDPKDGLAMSSRNAYLTPRARNHASVLYKALCAGRDVWDDPATAEQDPIVLVKDTLTAAYASTTKLVKTANHDGISIELLYISLNDPISLQDLSQDSTSPSRQRGAILSAAALIKEGDDGRVTRLIDNFTLGFSM